LQAAAASLEKSARDISRARARRLDTWLQVVIAVTALIVAVTSIVGAYAALF